MLTRGPVHDPAAQDMEVNMEDCLTCITIAVQDDAEPFLCDSFPMSYNVCNVEKMAEEAMVLLRNLKERGDMFSGDYESMDRCLRVDILESECVLIVIND